MQQQQDSSVGSANETKPAPLPWWAHVLCGWPLVMVAFGGAIGGGLGGGAYGVNVAIYRSRLMWGLKIVLIVLTGAAAIGLWALIAGSIRSRMR